MAQISFEFVGTTSKQLRLDTSEFKGLKPAKAAAEIRKLLSEIAPDVSFFEDDLTLAADVLLDPSNDAPDA